jgi:tetratricopeptide (TPR) repeat protein
LRLDARARDDNGAALSLFERALTRDGRFVLAHFGRGIALFDEISNQWSQDLQAALTALRRCADRCLEIDAGHPLGWAVGGRASFAVGDIAAGMRSFQRAAVLNPSFAYAHAALGQARVLAGDPAGFESLRLAARLSPRAYASGLAFALFATRDYERAAAEARAALTLRPRYVFAHVVLCASMGMIDPERATECRGRLLEIHPDFRVAGIRAMIPTGKTDTSDRLVAGLVRAGLG